MQPSEQIKSKLDVVDVIKEYVQLKPAGSNFRGKCPFHRENTPSFMVSPDKQIWHCFGCGKGGDIFRFVMEMEGLTFVEALRFLAPKAGVTLTKGDPRLASERNKSLDILELSARFYNHLLLKTEYSEKANEYLAKRGLDEDTIAEWQIGYSLDSWDALLQFLLKRGFNENEIFASGMTIRRDNKPGFYDRFRGRIMFPIRDVNGNTVAFTARVSPEKEATEKMGKYINSPQTGVYDKSRVLFALDRAKQTIKHSDYSIVVEGQMDAITAHQFGFKNVVASSGTALTADQVQLLKRYSRNVMLAFDMDKAGEMAAERGIREAMAADMNIKVIELPNGKDPDECIRNDRPGWEAAVRNAKPMMQYYFDKITSGLDLGNVDAKRTVAGKGLPMIARLRNPIEQDHWLKYLSNILGTEEGFLREALAPVLKKEKESHSERQPVQPIQTVQPAKGEPSLSEMTIALLLKWPEFIEYASNNIYGNYLEGDDNRFIYNNLIIYYNNIINERLLLEEVNSGMPLFDYKVFKNWLSALSNKDSGDFFDEDQTKNRDISQLSQLDQLALLADKDFSDFEQSDIKTELINFSINLKKRYFQKRMKELEGMIAMTESEKDSKKANELMEELKILMEEYRTIEA